MAYSLLQLLEVNNNYHSSGVIRISEIIKNNFIIAILIIDRISFSFDIADL